MVEVDSDVMYIFPGQGSQYVGMGSDLYEKYAVARDVYHTANEVLGFDVKGLSFEGPAEDLNRTRYTQPALLTHSIAALEVFRELTEGQNSLTVTAGHSLGEYSALVAAESLSFEDALRLVQRRGELMGEYGRGKMLAFRADLDTVREFADRFYCGIGGCNLPEQTVVGGAESDLEALAEYASSIGQRGIPLNTEGAFHTYLMVSAAEAFRPALDDAQIKPPRCKVFSNYTGTYHSGTPEEIKASLFFQLFNPVKWIWSVQQAIQDGVRVVIEFGGGIGKGEGPAGKRPNLQGITNKVFKGMGVDGTYLPVINIGTLESTVDSLNAAPTSA